MSQDPNEKQTDLDREEELRGLVYSVLNKIRQAPALNGGFAKLQEEISEVKEYQIRNVVGMEYLRTVVTQTQKKVEDIHETMYNPNNGLFTRVITLAHDVEDAAKSLSKQEEDTGRHSVEAKKNAERLNDLEDQSSSLKKDFETHAIALKKVAGDDLDVLKDLVKIRRNFNRVFWAVGLAFLAAFGKAGWDLVVYIQGILAQNPPPGH